MESSLDDLLKWMPLFYLLYNKRDGHCLHLSKRKLTVCKGKKMYIHHRGKTV